MNWGAIKAAVAAYSHRTDLASMMTSFLDLAEQRIYNGESNAPKVRVAAMRQFATLANGTRPAEFLEAIKVTPEDSPETPLYYRPLEQMPRERWAYTWDGTTMVLSEDQGFPVDLTYHAKFATPVDDADENWLMANAPNIYISSLLVEVGRWSRDDALGVREAANYASSVGALHSQEKSRSNEWFTAANENKGIGMTVESASYISQLDATLPTATDPKSEGDNQLRLLKSVLKAQFPNFGTAAMTASHTELNYMVGVTSAVQTQLNARALKAGDTYTGTHNFSGATSVTVPTATAGDNSANAASTAFVAATAFSSALPAQTGNNGKILNTDGTTAAWTDTITTSKSITGNLTFSGNGRRMYGNFDDITRANRFLFTNSGSSTQAALGVCPSVGGGIGASYEAFGGIDPDNSSVTSLFSNQFAFRAGIDSGKNGTGATLPLSFSINGVEAFKVDETTKDVIVTGGGGLGYGSGSGGTVTQLTSKSTTVTLDRPCGNITTHNAALAAGASVIFTVINSHCAANDTVIVNGNSSSGISGDNYRIEVAHMSAGGFRIRITNVSAGSLSQAILLNFSVIKSVNA